MVVVEGNTFARSCQHFHSTRCVSLLGARGSEGESSDVWRRLQNVAGSPQKSCGNLNPGADRIVHDARLHDPPKSLTRWTCIGPRLHPVFAQQAADGSLLSQIPRLDPHMSLASSGCRGFGSRPEGASHHVESREPTIGGEQVNIDGLGW
ncbi:hypothetical protein KVR01_009688 [Diaporthe batatas]|uniref:uncharacterized protein n=1 Tax=Diaporthe batatas TaxID=748121 RepID=UPI001D0384A9|nr:uncharacterized protein KVR01_009688 [Diaporthe batatas]KAG8160152.1 hypothetical protein KVR01_009688 [Diaporthe batatas]